MGRGVGAVMIVVALIGGLTAASITRAPMPGAAVVAPRPQAPAVGACVSHTVPFVTAVDCDRPHLAEVTAVLADDTSTDVYARCQQAADAYTGDDTAAGATGWTRPPVSTSAQIATGPTEIVLPGWSWRVCLVQPIAPTVHTTGYRGRIWARLGEETPAALRPCFTLTQVSPIDAADGTSFASGTTCDIDHAGEVIGVQTLTLPAGEAASAVVDGFDTDPVRQAGCAALARTRVGVADPTFQGRLLVRIRLQADGGSSTVTMADRPLGDWGWVLPDAPRWGWNSGAGAVVIHDTVRYTATCTLQAAPGGVLFSSVIGLDSGALPLR